MTSREIAAFLRVTKETVMRMLRGDTYQHVGMTAKEEILQHQSDEMQKRFVEKGLVHNPATGRPLTLEEWYAQRTSTASEEETNGLGRLAKEMSKHPDIILRELKGPANPLDE